MARSSNFSSISYGTSCSPKSSLQKHILPRWSKPLTPSGCNRLFEVHLDKTEAHAKRLNECCASWTPPARAKVYK